MLSLPLYTPFISVFQRRGCLQNWEGNEGEWREGCCCWCESMGALTDIMQKIVICAQCVYIFTCLLKGCPQKYKDNAQLRSPCDLRVHSFSGMLELMWMLSIQTCPLVPCAKKPSITTYHQKQRRKKERGRGGGGKLPMGTSVRRRRKRKRIKS